MLHKPEFPHCTGLAALLQVQHQQMPANQKSPVTEQHGIPATAAGLQILLQKYLNQMHSHEQESLCLTSTISPASSMLHTGESSAGVARSFALSGQCQRAAIMSIPTSRDSDFHEAYSNTAVSKV